MAQFEILSSQKIQVFANPLTDEDPARPARVDGTPVWQMLDGGPTDVTMEVAADGMSAWIVPGIEGGVKPFQVTVDADRGEGVTTVTQVFFVSIVEIPAAKIAITAGNPVAK